MKRITDEELLAYLHGDASKQVQEEIRHQVSIDVELASRLDELGKFDEFLQGTSNFEPPLSMKNDFSAELAVQKAPQVRQQWLPQMAAAVALLIIGIGLGRYTVDTKSSETVLLAQEVKTLKELVLTSQLQEQTASTRLQVVNSIQLLEATPSDEVINALIQTASADASPNVRYEAIQALGQFIDHVSVRQGLLQSLENQNDALIQIAIIQLLVKAEEKAAIATMKKLIKADDTSAEVKRQAEIAVEILI